MNLYIAIVLCVSMVGDAEGQSTQQPSAEPTAQHTTQGQSTQHPSAEPTAQHTTQGPSTQHPSAEPTAQHTTQGQSSQQPTAQPTTQAASPTTCITCGGDVDSDDVVTQCNSNEATVPCSYNVYPPNVGTTHCYIAAGSYKNQSSEEIRRGIVKGCINCTDKAAACADLKAAAEAQQNVTVLDCNIECCTGDNCNTQRVAAVIPPTPVYATPTDVTPTSEALGANITTCYSCFEDEILGDDVAKCNKNQRSVACSDGAFPNLGTTHCYTAAGRYGNNTFVGTGILRGCINCTDKEAACAQLTAAFRALSGNSSQLLDCNIECCTGKNCNNQSVLPPYAPNPITCRVCAQDDPFGDDVAMCNKNQGIIPCSYGEFSNVGTTHCFTAAGRYWNNENQRVSTGILRGCINCTDKAAACADLSAGFRSRFGNSSQLLDCNIECCTGDNCNNQSVLPPYVANQTTCHSCIGFAESSNDVAKCNSNHDSIPCKYNAFPNIGSTHCYKAEPRFKIQGSEHIFPFILKGCINCTDKEAACAELASPFARFNVTLVDCNIECCTGNNCNKQIPPSPTISTEPVYTSATPHGNNLYPHGPDQNDNEFGLDDFIYESRCLEIRTDQLGFPFFSRRHYKLHICRNGKIQLNFEWSVFWPRKFGVYRWFRNMAIMAPLWAATDPYLAFKSGYSKVYYQVYGNTKNDSAQSSYILTMASKHVQLYEKSGNFSNFQASWVLVVTWKNLCPYVYYRRLYYDDHQEIFRLNCSWSNTFQAVIISDGFNSFLMYNYPYGGIQWAVAVPCRLQKYYRYYTGVYGIPVAGWSAGDNGQNKLNIKGSGTLHGMCNLGKTPGNTGMMGRHFWRIENNVGKDALEKCFTWAKRQQDTNFLDWYKLHIEGDSSLACPCTGWQARLDRGRFVWDWTFSAGFWCYRSRQLKLFTYSSANKKFYFVVNQQCCYSTRLEDFASLKVGPPDGSRIKVTPVYYRRNQSQEAYTDQQAYTFCCVDRPELCDRFYFYRPSDNCSDYTPPRRRRGWGDPHFKTLDGGNYTFNGLGEYVLIDAQHGAFQLQARTKLAQGNSTTATIFSAGAAKEVNTDIVEVRVKSGGGIDILINETFYNGYNNLTNQSKEIGGNLSVSKPDENCLEVYFPSTTAVMFCEKKKMLLFVVALGDGYKNTTKGLLGTWNDDPDDEFTLPDGTVLPPSSSLREIHFGFGVKWQINQSQSLFTYGANESVDTFARPDFVPMFADNITWYNESVRLAAAAQCGNDLECLFDVASTNDLSVGMVTKDISIQLVNESNILDNFPPKIVNSPSVISAKIHETVRLNITAEDSDTITFRVINKPAGATVNQTGNVLHFTWFVTSSQKFNISFVATDDKGASTTWSPTINMCVCDHNGQCVPPEEGDELNTDNKFVYLGCACQGGYTGRFCESDIDACEMNGQPCYAGVECIDLPPPANVSGYTCGPCPSGYTGNGAQCADIDECQSNQLNSCGQDCVNIPGSFICDCYHGYELNADRRTCDDINECLPSNDCMQQCSNTPGNYNCSCNEYFEPDPADWRNCLPAKQCAAGHGCSQVCYKAENQQHCACVAKHELQSDGKTCKDIDECDPAKPRNRCDQICENTPGSYKCSCQKGFELTNDGYECEDINECVNEDLYNCTDEFHKCVNTRGSYKCECDQDLYFIDGKCRGLAKNETAPVPVLPAPRKPSKIDEEQAVQISISSNSQIKWDFQTDKSFKEKMASVTSDYCAQNRTKCALKEERRKRRALFFDLYTADEVHLLPGYLSNSSGTSQIAFYVKQPLGKFIGNISVLPRRTLVDIVITHKSELETAIGANISRVQALFQPTSIPPTKTSTTEKPSPSKATSSDNWKWIAIGVSTGVVAIILILILICVKKQGKSNKSVSPTEDVRLESLKTTGPGVYNPAHDSGLTPVA